MGKILRCHLFTNYDSALLSNGNGTVPHFAALKTVKSLVQTFLSHWELFDPRVDVVLCRKFKHSDGILTSCTGSEPGLLRNRSIEALLRNKISQGDKLTYVSL